MEPRKTHIVGVVLVGLWGDRIFAAQMASRGGPAGVREQGIDQRTPPGTWEARVVPAEPVPDSEGRPSDREWRRGSQSAS